MFRGSVGSDKRVWALSLRTLNRTFCGYPTALAEALASSKKHKQSEHAAVDRELQCVFNTQCFGLRCRQSWMSTALPAATSTSVFAQQAMISCTQPKPGCFTVSVLLGSEEFPLKGVFRKVLNSAVRTPNRKH